MGAMHRVMGEYLTQHQDWQQREAQRQDTGGVQVYSTYPSQCRRPLPTPASCHLETRRHCSNLPLLPKARGRASRYLLGLHEGGQALHLLVTPRSLDARTARMAGSTRISNSQQCKLKHLNPNRPGPGQTGALRQCILRSTQDQSLHALRMVSPSQRPT